MTDLAPAFAPGQVWTLLAPAPPAMRVRIGAVQEVSGRIAAHIEIAHAPVPEGFEVEAGAPAVSIGHVPIAGVALAAAVDRLESENVQMSAPWEEGYAVWRDEYVAGRAGFFDLSPLEIVAVIFEAYKQAKA